MRAGLVVDDPAHAVIHEGSVQDETPDLPFNDSRQGVFALVVFMPGKNPASLLVGRSVSKRNAGAGESFVQLLAVQALRPEGGTESVFAHGQPVPHVHLLQHAMHHNADPPLEFAGPFEDGPVDSNLLGIRAASGVPGDIFGWGGRPPVEAQPPQGNARKLRILLKLRVLHA